MGKNDKGHASMLGEIFDPRGELLVHEHWRPHWSQAGAVVFITFRTHDSIPREVVERWNREKQEWLRLHGLETGAHWSSVLPKLPEVEQAAFSEAFQSLPRSILRQVPWPLFAQAA